MPRIFIYPFSFKMGRMEDDHETGLFGIKIRMPTPQELEDLLHPKKKGEEKPVSFTYVPELNLSVADEVSMFRKGWYESKLELQKRGSRMLTPAEFWTYYSYCTKNKPEILEKSLHNFLQDEWLDAFVENKKVVIGPHVNFDQENQKGYTCSGGTTYSEIFLPEKGRFDFTDIHAGTGTPSSLKSNGAFSYLPTTLLWEERHIFYKLIKNDELENKRIVLSLRSPSQQSPYVGVREVTEAPKR